jgi:hypothetical protein
MQDDREARWRPNTSLVAFVNTRRTNLRQYGTVTRYAATMSDGTEREVLHGQALERRTPATRSVDLTMGTAPPLSLGPEGMVMHFHPRRSSAGQRGAAAVSPLSRTAPWFRVPAVGALTIEERRASDRDLIKLYREKLISTGAQGVPDQDAAWEQFRRWPGYGMQCWLGNVDRWGQSGLEMVRRFFAAADEFDTVALLTAGKTPRRKVTLGEGAAPLSPDLQQLRDSRQ